LTLTAVPRDEHPRRDELEKAVTDAEAALQEVEDAHAANELSPLAYGKAFDMATADLEAAEAALDASSDASTSSGARR
jgi:hypothetical protein